MICNLFDAPTYLVYSPDVPSLLYYAYIPTTILILFFGFYVFRKGKYQLLNRLLFLISLLFFFWSAAILILWTNIHSDFMIFTWSFLGTTLGLIAVISIYFVYVFLEKKDISRKMKFILLALLAPLLVFATTQYNLSGFDITACDAFRFESFPYKAYSSGLGFLAMLWILILLIHKYRRSSLEMKKQVVMMGTGIEILLFIFFGMEFLGTLLAKIGALPDSGIEIYGMLGMVVFIVYLNILTVRFKVFNIKLIATQALVIGLAALISSQLFVNGASRPIVVAITFFAAIILGGFLIKSVKREILQKEHLELLSQQLEESNEKLKGLDKLKTEFLSLASHQLRSPLTAIKGYASMLDEGSLGKLTPEQDTAAKRIYASAQGLVNLVEDLLNISKIEQGGMKYEMMQVELAKVVQDLAAEMKIPAENKGLALRVSIPENDTFTVTADPVKIKQVFLNLVDNSIKYTQSGFVEVGLSRADHMIHFTVRDSGVGITPETKAKLFQKFSRGEGAKINTGGSGLGLYLAQEIAKAHKGEIKVDSEGLGKGTTFTVILPAA